MEDIRRQGAETLTSTFGGPMDSRISSVTSWFDRIYLGCEPFKFADYLVAAFVRIERWTSFADFANPIVGLRAYSAKSNILPEQTLGRGLRRMYPSENGQEYVSVVGTDAFMDFVESIQTEGVELEKREMGTGTKPVAPLIVEVDQQDKTKDLDELDIEIPVLSPRVYREYKKLSDLNVDDIAFTPVEYKQFSEEEQREIVFRDITTGEISHITRLDTAIAQDYRSVVGYFAQTILRELRLFAA